MIAKKEKKRSLTQEVNKSSIVKQMPKKFKAENVEVSKAPLDSLKKKKEKKVINKSLEKPEKLDKTKLKPNKNSSNNNKSSLTQKSVDGKNDNIVKSRTPKRKSLMQKFIPMEDLKKRIQELQAEDSLSKSAKKRLTIFKRKLSLMESGVVPNTLEEHKSRMQARRAGNANPSGKNVAQKQAQKQKGENAKKNLKQAQVNKQNKKKAPQSQAVADSDEEEDETDEDEDDDDEMESEDISSTKQNAKKAVVPSRKMKQEEEEDDEDDDEEDEDEDEDEGDSGDEDGVQNVSKMDTDEDGEDDDDDEDEDEDEEESDESENEDEKTTKKNSVPQKVVTKNENEGKKKRYVLFVGNLPYTVNQDQIEKHFLTKVSEVLSVRMPLKPDGSGTRGFAYVEFSNQMDYEKGLALHESFLGGRKLNVQYSEPNAKFSRDKNKAIGKNKKLQELRKAGKLAGGRPNKQFQQRKKQK